VGKKRDGETKLFRITGGKQPDLSGIEFEVAADADENQIAEAAHEAIVEWLSYGWEEVKK
jgi:hypothetical protein